MAIIRLERRYDPERSTLTFSAYAGRILRRRVVDWFRQTLGDSRYSHGPEKLVPRGEGAVAVELEDGSFALELVDHGRPFTEESNERLALVEGR